jgi:hypothetical protein
LRRASKEIHGGNEKGISREFKGRPEIVQMELVESSRENLRRVQRKVERGFR